jgi:SAM-dependent methyltransferase
MATRLIRTESALLERAMGEIYGFELLQLGRWGARGQLLASHHIRHQTVIDAQPGADIDVVARLHHLPVPNAAIDAVLLPHVLEFEADPYTVIREADRVLVGEGQLLVLGFRPASPWGWRATASRSGFPPGSRRLLSEQRVRDWLKILNYDIVEVQRFLYSLPFEGRGGISNPAGNAPYGMRRGWFYPWPAGAYLLRARKCVYTVTPLRVRRRERSTVLGGALESSR